jgi:energy-converting hydrogenase Eha subunit E
MGRILSAIGFVFVAALFLLPFGSIHVEDSMNGKPTARISETWYGIDLAFGGATRFHMEELTGDGTGHDAMQDVTKEFEAMWHGMTALPLAIQPAYLVAAVLLLLGAVASLVMPARLEPVVSAMVAFATIGALVVGHALLLYHFSHRLQVRLTDMLLPDYGFWLASGVLLSLGVVNEIVARRSRRTEPAAPAEPPAVAEAG